MGIEAELCAVTKIKIRSRETFNSYATRIVEAIGKLEEPEWDSLSEEAQKWCNTTIDAINYAEQHGQTPNIDQFPENVIAEALAATETTDDSETESIGAPIVPEPTEPIIRGNNRNTGKSSNRVKKARGTIGVTWRMKQIIAANTAITIKQLMDQLEVEGYKASENTIIGISSDFRQSLRILDEMGLLKKND